MNIFHAKLFLDVYGSIVADGNRHIHLRGKLLFKMLHFVSDIFIDYRVNHLLHNFCSTLNIKAQSKYFFPCDTPHA